MTYSFNWTALCGQSSFKIWDHTHRDISSCFLDICVRFPIYAIFGMVSAYYVGNQGRWLMRSKRDSVIVYCRSVITSLLAILSVMEIVLCVIMAKPHILWKDVLISGSRTVTWFIHLAYVLALRSRLCTSVRGPCIVQLTWMLTFLTTAVTFRSFLLIAKVNYSIFHTIRFYSQISYGILQSMYLFSLAPSGEAHVSRYEEFASAESEPFVGSYSGFEEDDDPSYLGVAKNGISWWARLTFSWVSPLMAKGSEGRLNTSDDLHDLPPKLSSGYVRQQFSKVEVLAATEQTVQKSRITMLQILHRTFGVEFYSIGILKFLADACLFASPLLLKYLIDFIENDNETMKYGLLYAFGLFSTTLLGSLLNTHFDMWITEVGLKIRASLIMSIYKKALNVSSIALSKFSVGEIVNFMSTDTDRIVNFGPSFHAFWSCPIQVGITLFLLYQQIGISFLAGLIFAVILIPINRYFAIKIRNLNENLMQYKDCRVKAMTEVLKGIRVVKFHAWEEQFIRKVTELRDAELKTLKSISYLDAFCVYFWATTPVLISLLTFTTYSSLGNELTAAKVFTSIALFNMLVNPLNAFPWVVNGVLEAWVSMKRVQKLFELQDMNVEKYYTPMPRLDSSMEIFIHEGFFSWNTVSENEECFRLKDIQLQMKKGQFIGIYGRVGSGKTSFLHSILAELSKDDGIICVSDPSVGYGYSGQDTWLQHKSVKENILFGKAFDFSRYRAVLDSCSLTQDFDITQNKDGVLVGEEGVMLSGGQKARISLARAVYQNKDIYLLDDILSAVDVYVAREIFTKCIMGMLQHKTRILCTHHVQYLAAADWVIMLEDGKIVSEGPPSLILQNNDNMDSFTSSGRLESLCTPLSVVETSADPNVEIATLAEHMEGIEEQAYGTIDFSVYKSYWKAVGHILSVLVLSSLFLMQASRNVSDWWLSFWVTCLSDNHTVPDVTPSPIPPTYIPYDASASPSKHSDARLWQMLGSAFEPVHDNMESAADVGKSNVTYYLTVYGSIAAGNSLFTLLRAFLFAYGGICAATTIHKNLLAVILKAQISFFDRTPLGQIINRFSSDIAGIDSSLPFNLNILLAQVFALLGTVVMTCYGVPWAVVLLVPLSIFYYFVQKYYRLSSRELKRISSVTLSPIYTHFSETLRGLVTIRAFRVMPRFLSENLEYLESNQKARYATKILSQWLTLRLQLIGVIMITGVSLIAIVQHEFHSIDPGLVGLALTYALVVTGNLNGAVTYFTETEKEMVAVERTCQYIESINRERTSGLIQVPYAWPAQGVVIFRNVTLRYRETLPPALKNVCFETRPSEKVGIVGRTGSGKSSLFQVLFRMVDVCEGNVVIDCVGIRMIGLKELRSRMAVIPQDPFLFSGTLRENLDPCGSFTDSELWRALKRCKMSTSVNRLGGLDAQVGERGRMFSAGEKQLVCLARALLLNAKILCIDEATANVDQETDSLIQQTLKTSFCQSTVLTIAHRINTILDSNRVLVMSEGEVVEFDCPQKLLHDTNSHFYNLVNENNA